MPLLLVIVLDCNPTLAGYRHYLRTKSDPKTASTPAPLNRKGPGLLGHDIIQSLIHFLQIISTMNRENEWVVIGTTPTRTACVGRSSSSPGVSSNTGLSPTVEIMVKVIALIESSLADLPASGYPLGGVTAGLTNALCMVNKIMGKKGKRKRGVNAVVKANEDSVSKMIEGETAGSSGAASSDANVSGSNRVLPHILVLQTSPDNSADYNAAMNCAFAAKKDGIQIDAIYITSLKEVMEEDALNLTDDDNDSTLLHQVTDLTEGIYMLPPGGKPQCSGGLTQILVTAYLSGLKTNVGVQVNEGFVSVPKLAQGRAGGGERSNVIRGSEEEKRRKDAALERSKNSSARDILSRVVTERVDFRGRCFKTGVVLAEGLVCNLCLSVFGDEVYEGGGARREGGVKFCYTCGAEVDEREN